MPRDYKTRATPQRKKAATPGWVWFLGGLLVGLFVSGLAWLKFSGADNPLFTQEQSPPSPKMKKVEKPKAASQKTKAAPKPRFDFYTILPEMEVVVPEPEPEFKPAPGDTPKVRDAVSRLPEGGYMLQMGSFRKFADADRLKASLALVGIVAEIQRVTVNGDEIFHRVRSGPYSRDKVNALRARLKANNINSLVIKLKE